MVQNILRIEDVTKATGFSRATLYRKISANEFPRPIPITARSRGWLEQDIADWQKARIAARDGGAA